MTVSSAQRLLPSWVNNRDQWGPGIYVHIPFCAQKCFYCDFTAYFHQNNRSHQYLADLMREIQLYSSDGEFAGVEFRSVYVGGGTPSILTAEQVQTLMDALRSNFNIAADSEITLEANPEDLSAEKLNAWKEAGINRLSVGAQTSQNSLLSRLGRKHTWEAVVAGVERAWSVGFNNINLDLMFGLPGQTLEQWEDTLSAVINLNNSVASALKHISCYGLQIEEQTTYYRWHKEGRIVLPNDEDERLMFEAARQRLTCAGFVHYEIANFARPGYQSRHNLNYWANGFYLGLGAGAWSHWAGRRYGNERQLRRYSQLVRAGARPIAEWDHPDDRTRMAEAIMLGTRLIDGMPTRWFLEQFGRLPQEVFATEFSALTARGLLTVEPHVIRLTREGRLLANIVWQELF